MISSVLESDKLPRANTETYLSSIYPVSYTHLDVYKRQVLLFIIYLIIATIYNRRDRRKRKVKKYRKF